MTQTPAEITHQVALGMWEAAGPTPASKPTLEQFAHANVVASPPQQSAAPEQPPAPTAPAVSPDAVKAVLQQMQQEHR